MLCQEFAGIPGQPRAMVFVAGLGCVLPSMRSGAGNNPRPVAPLGLLVLQHNDQLSSPSEGREDSSVAPVWAMFCRSAMGVPALPYKLVGPAKETWRVLGSLVLRPRWEPAIPLRAGVCGSGAVEHPSMRCSLMSISMFLVPSNPLSWDSVSVLSRRGVVSRTGNPGGAAYSPPYA